MKAKLPITVEFPDRVEVVGFARTAKLRRLAWRWLKEPGAEASPDGR